MNTGKKLCWGLVGTGNMAILFAKAIQSSPICPIVNVIGTSPEKSRNFSETWKIDSWSKNFKDFLNDRQVEAVYIATPNHTHEELVLKCLESGRHVLCQKPLTLSYSSANTLLFEAKKQGVFLMEAWMYRCNPLISVLIDRIQAGDIGSIQHIESVFGFRAERNWNNRLFSEKPGGGSIYDVGGYPVSFCRLIAGVKEGRNFSEPKFLEASGHIGPTGVDEYAEAKLLFPSGITAQIKCAIYYDIGTETIITGDKGRIIIPNAWFADCNNADTSASFSVHKLGENPEFLEIHIEKSAYLAEAELVATSLPQQQAPWPAMSWEDSLGNCHVLEQWHKRINEC